MATKQCGTCEFWDRENALDSVQYENRQFARCKQPPHSAIGKYETYNTEGTICAVYKQIKEE